MSMQVVADIDNDLEVGVFLGAYRQLAQRQDLETRRLCAESCAAVLKVATPRRSAIVKSQAFSHWKKQTVAQNRKFGFVSSFLESPFLQFLLLSLLS